MIHAGLDRDRALLPEGDIQVLHVDDEPDFAELSRDMVEAASDRIQVETETEPTAALERLRADPDEIDCLVSDYDMPGRDGIELLEAVRQDFPRLPFILFTGKGSEEVASEAITKGVTDYLQKEVGTEQYAVLANRIVNVVARRRAEQRVRRGYWAMETAREGIGILDEDGYFTYVNPAYADLVGYDRAALVGEHWEVLYRDEDVDHVHDEILPDVPEEGRWTGENVYVRADGAEVTVDHALSFAGDGSMICLIRRAE